MIEASKSIVNRRQNRSTPGNHLSCKSTYLPGSLPTTCLAIDGDHLFMWFVCCTELCVCVCARAMCWLGNLCHFVVWLHATGTWSSWFAGWLVPAVYYSLFSTAWLSSIGCGWGRGRQLLRSSNNSTGSTSNAFTKCPQVCVPLGSESIYYWHQLKRRQQPVLAIISSSSLPGHTAATCSNCR